MLERRITPALGLVAAVLLAAGCAAGEQNEQAGPDTSASRPTVSSSGDSQPPGPPTPTSTFSSARTIDVSITEGQVQPPPRRVRVDRGQTVRIVVTSDQADKLHVHGYDKEAELRPGTPATVTFTADQTGVFEVESHDSALQLFQLVVR